MAVCLSKYTAYTNIGLLCVLCVTSLTHEQKAFNTEFTENTEKTYMKNDGFRAMAARQAAASFN
jgi:hypothetical protein